MPSSCVCVCVSRDKRPLLDHFWFRHAPFSAAILSKEYITVRAVGPTRPTSPAARVSEPLAVLGQLTLGYYLTLVIIINAYLFTATAVTSLFYRCLLLSSLYILCSRWPPKKWHVGTESDPKAAVYTRRSLRSFSI